MTQVRAGRWSADVDDGTVVFLIGMRVNRVTKPWKWIPAATAMRAMLAELGAAPDLGLLGAQQFVSGRTVLVVQYWRSWDHLHAYSRDDGRRHLPAWRAFNRRTRGNRDVGVFHETYVTHAGNHEAIYVNMPAMGVARATRGIPASTRGNSAAHRLDPSVPDSVTVA